MNKEEIKNYMLENNLNWYYSEKKKKLYITNDTKFTFLKENGYEYISF